ncbi:hypothetical protein [Flavobacterium sp. B17]|uniref:hypothetical protein n=1 Tax=Flavobacterium sp. B17 TaxID=95618 RepID=UPI00034B51C7|nr:hypothetical protein [Flavobacterium sp. B17]
MKHLFTTAALLFSMTAFAQVGINNTSPKATLDITAKTSGTKPEGLIIPQLSGDQIRTATAGAVYGTNQKGLIVYASSADTAPAGATASITAAGYYYFDGTNWQKMTGAAAADATTTSKGIIQLAGDLAGTAASPTVAKIQNKTVSSTVPTNGQVLKYNTGTSSWEPAADTDTNTTYTAGSGITLTGTSFSANDATTSAKGIVQLAGDLAGTATSPTVAKIQSKAVSSTAPTNGQVLKYNTTTSSWEPAADTDTNTTYTAGSGMTLTGTSFSANDATTSAKGIVQLAGDLAGTAASPSIAGNAINSAKIADGTVANADLANMAALTVKGNATNAAASPTDIAAGTDGYVLRRSGTTLGFGTVDTAGITDGAVTTNKILNGTVANTDLDAGVGGIYKGSGALSGNTTVAQDVNNLAFTSTATTGTSHFTVDGPTLNVDAVNDRIGIGTSSPQATLDITAKTTDGSRPEGFIAPRLSGDDIQKGDSKYTPAQKGAIVYALSAVTTASIKTINIDTEGYYVYDGSKWVKLITQVLGVPTQVLSVSVPGTQNINNGAYVPVQFTIENLDLYNAWTGNVFTVPVNKSGTYVINMQTSNGHTAGSVSWFLIAAIEKSSDGGTSWQVLTVDTRSPLSPSDYDNGNILFWSGGLNAGDKIRIKSQCSAPDNNIILRGSLVITKF